MFVEAISRIGTSFFIMNYKDKFLAIDSKEELARFLQIEVKSLTYLAYKLKKDRYKKFTIPKKNGGERTIESPCLGLKKIQNLINTALYDIYKNKMYVHGFCSNRSILTNAETHKKQKFVVNIDLENFFNTINFGRIRGLFLNYPFCFNDEVATLIAQICCHQGYLPQGAITSPILSNFICHNLDKDLYNFSKKHILKYTRYADDITFSTSRNKVPDQLGTHSYHTTFEIGDDVRKIILKNGFTLNDKKSRIFSKGNRQEVTGLVVNEFPNVRRTYVRELRGIINAINRHGYENAQKQYLTKYRFKKSNGKYLENVLRGKLEFLKHVKGSDNATYINLINSANKAHPMYSDKIEGLPKLLNQFNELKLLTTPDKKAKQDRGYKLEVLLKDLFSYFNIPVIKSFKRNSTGDQIDGAFKFDGWNYLFECKWHKTKVNSASVDPFYAKVNRGSNATLGLFLSINGWSDNVVKGLKNNKDKNVILMNGEELEMILGGEFTISKAIEKKNLGLSTHANPYTPL